MQFDSHPQSSRPESFLIPFNSRPVAPLQNHALAAGEEILGKNPQLMFKTHSEFFIPQIGAQLSRPPPKLAPRVVSHPVQLAPSGPTPKSRSGRRRGERDEKRL